MDNQHLFSKRVSLKYGDEFVLNSNGTVEGVRLYTDSKTRYVFFYSKEKPSFLYRLHREIYKAFCGEIPQGYYINHIDGNKENNNISNLELVNSSYSSCHMRYSLGKSCGNGRGSLTPIELNSIIGKIQSNSYKSWEIADLHNINRDVVIAINPGKKYKFYTEQILNLKLPITDSPLFFKRRPRNKVDQRLEFNS